MSAPDGSSNPWQEEKVVPASPPALLAQPQALSVTTADLSEFDPLVTEGKAQQDAWADEDGHPPPPATPSKDELAPPPSARDAEVMSPPKSTSSISFPFVASIARTLARATTPTPRDRAPQPAQEQQHDHQQQQDQQTDQTSRQPPKDAPFDFQRFLEQMKMRSAEPVAKYLRSFLSNFSKKSFTVNDQVKVIHNFLSFISDKMREVEPWRNLPESEFDNAVEAMEKLVMNKLYDLTFTPQIDRTGRSVSTDDLERDHVLEQRIRLFSWVDESHLEVPDGDNVQGFYHFAEQELLKVNHYKAPRDKLICILNSCKVIFGLIRHAHADEGADSFLPILIFVVLRAHPEHLISNVEYINRFRRASKLQSEAGYYLSSLMGAISFIETMDHTSLSNITQEEFEENVETAIQELPPSPDRSHSDLPQTSRAAVDSPMAGEESARPLQLPTPSTIAEDTKRFLQRTGDLAQVAQQTISKPLNAIGRIFNEVLDTAEERLRSQNSSSSLQQQQPQQPQYGYGPPGQPWSPDTPQRADSAHVQQYFPTTYEPRIRGSSPGASPGPGPPPGPVAGLPPVVPSQQQQWAFFQQQQQQQLQQQQQQQHQHFQQQQQQAYYGGDPNAIARTATPALDFGALSHEIERIDAAHRAAYDAAAATLQQIFPTADPEVVEMVLEANDGDLGRSIEALLEMTGVSAASLPPSLVPSPVPQVGDARPAELSASQPVPTAVTSDTRPGLRTEPQPYDMPGAALPSAAANSPTKPASPEVPTADPAQETAQPVKPPSPTHTENPSSTS